MMLSNFYKSATVNDQFICAFSGLGYMYPDYYGQNLADRGAALDEYYRRTAEYMEASGLEYVSILEWSPDNVDNQMRQDLLAAYSKYDTIKGGFLYYIGAPEYCKRGTPEAGAIYWSNDKPFINLRDSLGIFSEEAQPLDKRMRLMAELAYRINSYSTNCTKIEGYSAVNIHPWSYSYDDCITLTTLLDEDVKVVSLDEFMDLVIKNVEHTDVMQLTDSLDFDYSNMKMPEVSSAYDYDKVQLMLPSTRTEFDFTDGTQGWVPFACDGSLDQAFYAVREDEDTGVENFAICLAGSKFGDMDDKNPNAMVYNKLALDASASTMAVNITNTVNGSDPLYIDMRLAVLTEEGESKNVTEWQRISEPGEVEFDISEYAGQTVTFYVQFSDGSANGCTADIGGIEIF